LDFVGAAFRRDRFNSRLACDELSRAEAAPTGVFYVFLQLGDVTNEKLVGKLQPGAVQTDNTTDKLHL
jgi:hypothetical protein